MFQYMPLSTIALKTTQGTVAHLGPLSQVPDNFFPIKSFVSTPVKCLIIGQIISFTSQSGLSQLYPFWL